MTPRHDHRRRYTTLDGVMWFLWDLTGALLIVGLAAATLYESVPG